MHVLYKDKTNLEKEKKEMRGLTNYVLIPLTFIGALNWGLVGIFQFDLVAWLFGGTGSLFSRLVYTIVGLAGLWSITFLFRRNAVTDGE